MPVFLNPLIATVGLAASDCQDETNQPRLLVLTTLAETSTATS